MAKKSKKSKASGDTLTRITLRGVLQMGETRVYGIVTKAIEKDTPFGVAHGVKGTFEVVNGDGAIRTTKQAFLGDDVQRILTVALAANVTDKGKGKPIMFGVIMTPDKDGKAVVTEFFHDAGPADPLASLREIAQSR